MYEDLFLSGSRHLVKRNLTPVWRTASAALVLWGTLLLCAVQPAAAQGAGQYVQGGIGVVPGFGLQGGYVATKSFFTTEGMLLVDVSPQFAGGEGSAQVSLGLGGALRPLSLVRLIGNTGYTDYDLDFGLRVGPALFFAFDETRVTKNQRFSLFLEPYARITSNFKGRRLYFAEIGIQRPLVRVGVWFGL